VPYWADDLKIGSRLINARAETIERTPAFREAYRRRRCLVPADGFFEWRKAGKARQPLLIRRRDLAPFAFAGLWERWRQPDGGVLRSCTIVTCPPNALVAPVHDRMPVILEPEDFAPWLDCAQVDALQAQALLKPAREDHMDAYEISPAINRVVNDGPEVLEPYTAPDSADAAPKVKRKRKMTDDRQSSLF
jgi:putative SOS response-associated peptidase YedK